ncbi:MAG: hypothetical protein AAB925_02245 [Patescibacteria group bacterium]
MTWETLYNYLGIKDFIYYISSPDLQDILFPVKLVFVCFAMFFLAAVIYFMLNSSWLQYKFLEDVTEFFSWQPYGLRTITKRWKKIKEKLDTGVEAEYKLAVIEADDFLGEMLEERGFLEENFEDAIKKAGKGMLPNLEEILSSHEIRNSVVYNPDFKISAETAKNILSVYETAIINLGAT